MKSSEQLLHVNEHAALLVEEKEKMAVELFLAYKNLSFEINEKEKMSTDLSVVNKALLLQLEDREKRAEELVIANRELAFQNKEKESRANELIIANKELLFQNEQKRKRAEELVIANKELAFQNKEKECRADELIIANKELLFQNEEKRKRAEELVIANKELAFQNKEKESRADELIVANKELLFQNEEKRKRAEELVIANRELAFQNREKEGRADELIVANKELLFQNEEKRKRAEELATANKELEQFTYIASHDLQEPLRTISNYLTIFEEDYTGSLDDKAKDYISSIKNAINRMSLLIKSLLGYSNLKKNRKLARVDCNKVLDNVISDLDAIINSSHALISVTAMPIFNAYETEMHQLFQNLISNSIRFRRKNINPEIQISSEKMNEGWKFSVKDNGIGIESKNFFKVFEIFQQLDIKEKSEGCGIGLANCKKIIQLHKGKIWIESILDQGTTFYFTVPNLN